MDLIVALIKTDPVRLEALECVRRLNLPQCYLAAGFLRNLVWDYLHKKKIPTKLGDVDVIYYDPARIDPEFEKLIENQLTEIMPRLNWQVKNQARIHLYNNDPSYQSTRDAMSYWPEKETAVAIRKLDDGNYECISAFGFESLLDGHITHNLKRTRECFVRRVKTKNWLIKWP